MEERKPDKKPIIWYWAIAIVIFLLLNMFVFPRVMQHNVKEVGYDTFISMMENKEIGSVEVESSQITFTNKDETEYYKTGVLDDPDLVNRLYESGAKFQSEIVSTVSPITYFLVSYILPILLIFLVFRLFTKKMGDRAGGNSMMFGMGKSNAKVYVQSTNGIRFSDVAGEDEAKENLAEIVDYLHNPAKYTDVGASMPKGVLLVGPPGTGKTTVVAAICHRLLELADKKEKDSAVKTILASAFQNDTIEHLASKVYTHGLPTVKVGKKTMGVRAEERFISDYEKDLQKEIDSYSKQLRELDVKIQQLNWLTELI